MKHKNNARTMARIMAGILAAVLALGVALPAFAAEIEPDGDAVPIADEIAVPLAPEQDPVTSWAIDNGFLPETCDSSAYATRRMVAVVCYKLAGEPAVRVDCEYADVDAADEAYSAICFVAENGIMRGYGNGMFGPDDAITRGQGAAVAFRYAMYDRGEIGLSVTFPIDTGYKDFDAISDWAKIDVAWAVETGLIPHGDGESEFYADLPVANTYMASAIRAYLFFIGAGDSTLEKGPAIEHPEVKVDEDLLKEIMPMV